MELLNGEDGSPYEDEREVVGFAESLRRNARLAAFSPGVYDGDLDLFAATSDRPTGVAEPSSWSRHVTGEVIVHDIDCGARPSLPSGLSQLGPHLARLLR